MVTTQVAITMMPPTGRCSILYILVPVIRPLTHLQSGTAKPVQHWIESVDRLIRE